MTNKKSYMTYIVLDSSQNSIDFGASLADNHYPTIGHSLLVAEVTNTKYCQYYQIFKIR